MRCAESRWTRMLALYCCICLVEATQVHPISRSNSPWLDRQDIFPPASTSAAKVPSRLKFLQEPLKLPAVKSRFHSPPRRASLSSSPTSRYISPVPSPPASAGPASPKAPRMKRAMTLPDQLDMRRDQKDTAEEKMTPVAEAVAEVVPEAKATLSETSDEPEEAVKVSDEPRRRTLRGLLPSLRLPAGDFVVWRTFSSSLFSILVIRLLIQAFMTGTHTFVCSLEAAKPVRLEHPLYYCSIAPKTGLAFYDRNHVTQIMALSSLITLLKVFHQNEALVPFLYFLPSPASALHAYPAPGTTLLRQLPPDSFKSFLADEQHIWLMAAISTALFLHRRFPSLIQS